MHADDLMRDGLLDIAGAITTHRGNPNAVIAAASVMLAWLEQASTSPELAARYAAIRQHFNGMRAVYRRGGGGGPDFTAEKYFGFITGGRYAKPEPLVIGVYPDTEEPVAVDVVSSGPGKSHMLWLAAQVDGDSDPDLDDGGGGNGGA